MCSLIWTGFLGEWVGLFFWVKIYEIMYYEFGTGIYMYFVGKFCIFDKTKYTFCEKL